ncbi:MAG: imidazole glycerol phosphate synthase subunit HisH [Candidatus Omnitrophica bacterium]|nr:imidazole glycerol phosphate synthase subunit HisH [Candidatus Omnitrophota bacterium]
MKKVRIIDYYLGNIFSVARAFESFGCDVKTVNTPEGLEDADHIVLPGVGAFGEGMRRLNERGMSGPIRDVAASGKPLMGICLGMQLLFSFSEEFGRHEGLGIIPGGVKRLPEQPGVKIPHIGWGSIVPYGDKGEEVWDGSILKKVRKGKDMYFVHSYAACPEEDESWIAGTLFGENIFCSGVMKGNIYGFQFHPEKSGMEGLKILEEFLKL